MSSGQIWCLPVKKLWYLPRTISFGQQIPRSSQEIIMGARTALWAQSAPLQHQQQIRNFTSFARKLERKLNQKSAKCAKSERTFYFGTKISARRLSQYNRGGCSARSLYPPEQDSWTFVSHASGISQREPVILKKSDFWRKDKHKYSWALAA